MAARFDTQHFLTGKTGAASTVMTCAAANFSVNAPTLSALAWGTAP